MSKDQEIEQLIDNLALEREIRLPILPEVEDGEVFRYTFSPESIEGEGLSIPILPLRDVVLLPGQILSVRVRRRSSVKLLEWIRKTEGVFAVLTQRDPAVEHPQQGDLYRIGVIAHLLSLEENQDGLAITIRGLQRFELKQLDTASLPFLVGQVTLREEDFEPAVQEATETRMMAALIRRNIEMLVDTQRDHVPRVYLDKVRSINHTQFLINLGANMLHIGEAQRQMLLEIDNLQERAMKVLSLQEAERQVLELKYSLTMKTQREMDKQQREYFLQQQIRTFQGELGTGAGGEQEIQELRDQAKTKAWTQEVSEIFEREVKKAERLPIQTPDYAMQIQYLRTILSLPWGIYTEDHFDLKAAERRLNDDHYGLERVKERILEHLSVLKLKGDMKSPIICLYGPPGVGKTSLGRSIAESLGRKYVRVALGGLHDEAEIRGHRRTYIGAMCGRIMQSLQKAGSSNPVFVLDEIDKIGSSHRGDPASALLEVLDPEQNVAFHDNYLDIDYDLSKVLFIATANNVSAIDRPLLDRMELIEVSGYTSEEKQQIALRHLVDKNAKDHGLEGQRIKFTPKAIDTIVDQYTRESGVRQLNKQIASIMRKVARNVASGETFARSITPKQVSKYLGKPIFVREKYQGSELPGVAIGLAWTSVGGEIIYIETSLHRGPEHKLSLTGSLGEVMKESAMLALGYIRAHQDELQIGDEAIKERAIHIHVPAGAVPKDGPSAGITMLTSIVSAMTQRPVRPFVAMTGEITLRGKVLPVGGIKEKVLAARRAGMTDIILCQANEKDIADIDAHYLTGLRIHYVEEVGQVLKLALLP